MNAGFLMRIWVYLSSGGWVAPPLVAIGLLLWYLLTLRWFALWEAGRCDMDASLQALDAGREPPVCIGLGPQAQERLRVVLQRKPHILEGVRTALLLNRWHLSAWRKTIRILVTISPLLGLLGTVSGMIETFASLGDSVLFSRSGGIAGGISVALVSTQMGLMVAIPGLLASRVLDARQQRLEDQMERMHLWLAAHVKQQNLNPSV